MKEIHGFFLFLYNINVFFLLLSCAFHPLSCTPSSPSSTDPQNLPVSSASVAENPPFFPAYPLAPPLPPPPPPPTLTTYPADISALVVPRSPETQPKSRKLLIPAISGVISVAAAACIVFFLCRRRQRQNGDFRHGSKYLTSDHCSQEYASPNLEIRNTSRKLAVNPSSSEVLYLGNVVNSHSLDDDPSHPRNDSGSPELRPLPPLSNHQTFEQNDVVVSVTEEEEEKEDYEDDDDFYSTTTSLAGTEISSRFRSSGSGQISAVQAPATRNSVSSTCSCSTFSSNSHGKSVSITISPDASSSPQRSDTRNWNLPFVQNPRSPSMSVASTSPEKDLVNHGSESLRVFSFLNRQLGLPRISTASTSPERGFVKTPDAYARSSFYSSASTSPDGVFEKILRASPAKSNDFGRNVQSVLLSSSSISPIKEFSDDPDRNPAALYHFGQNLHPRSIPGTNQTISAPPPPPPPPCQPNTGATITEPPPLARPSLPFVGRNPRKWRSLSELPVISSETPEPPKPKLKPLHWDKFRTVSSRKTVWDRLRSSSFKLNEEMIGTLFDNSKPEQTAAGFEHPESNQDCRILDSGKAQNIGILLRSLNVSAENACEALVNGDVAGIGTELLESLSKIHLSEEEIRQLKGHKDDSPVRLGAAEEFLKSVLDVPFAFKRVDALLYVATFDSEVKTLKESFEILQAACDELKTSRMFLKLLEYVLQTGKRMNVGTNHGDVNGFKLDTLLRLVDVKVVDGKTSLLHFVVQEIIRLHSEEDGEIRKHGLQAISNLSSELSNVKKSAAMDFNALLSDVNKLAEDAAKIKEVLTQGENMGSDEKMWKKFSESMSGFLNAAEVELRKVHAQESSVLSAVKEITEYFHGDLAKDEAHPFRIFMVVRDFLTVLDGVCKEISVLSSACKFQFH